MTDAEFVARMMELNEQEQHNYHLWQAGFFNNYPVDYNKTVVLMNYRPQGGENDQYTVFNNSVTGIHSWFHAQRHGRYSPCPPHSHNYVEIAYMLRGQLTQQLEGKQITLREGDLLLLSPAAVHRVELAQRENLMINIMLFPHRREKILFSSISNSELLDTFLTDAVYRQAQRPNYLLIRRDDDALPQMVLLRLLRKYHEQAQEQTLEQLLSCFFSLLAQKISTNPSCVSCLIDPDSTDARLVQYIEEHCVSCTLTELGRQFGYNESWLSTKIKRYTGKNFVQLRNEFRLLRVEEQLNLTTLAVKTVAEQCGFHDSTQFYRLYRSYFGRRPRELPKNNTL